MIEAPCFIDAGAVVKTGARIGPYSVLGRHCHVGENAVVDGAILWANTWVDTEAHVGAALAGRHCHFGRNTEVGAAHVRRQVRHHRLFPRLRHPRPPRTSCPSTRASSRPTTSAGCTRRRSTRPPRATSAAGSSPISARSASACRATCALSSPSLAAAFIEGARAQGADVVDYGLCGTDMLYFAVARDGLDGGAQITASHNPKAYNGIKMVRREAFPLSGDAGIGEIRDMIAAGTIPAPARQAGRPRITRPAARLRRQGPVVHRSGDHQAVQRRARRRQRHGRAWSRRKLFDRLPCRTTRLCFEMDGTFPNHEANPLIEENRRDIVERVVAERADIGIAWDGDADRCFFIDGDGEFIAGDFVTALLAEAALRKSPGQKIVYDVRASYAVKDIVSQHGGTALMNRVGHAFIKRRMREEDALFGGEVTGHYYFRDFYYADNGFIPALLILELMSTKNMTLRDLLAPLRAKYFISGEINTQGGRHLAGRRPPPRAGRALQGRPHLRARRVLGRISRTGTSTSAARTRSRCCD